jgi:glyoxylase I family protein
MGEYIRTGAVHHVRLTVTDVDRACAFYTEVLGFRKAMELSSGVFLTNGAVELELGPCTYPATVTPDGRHGDSHVGIGRLSFAVDSRAALEEAARILDKRSVPRSEIADRGSAFNRYTLVFRDPDNVQLELSAPRRDPVDKSDDRDSGLPAGLPV